MPVEMMQLAKFLNGVFVMAWHFIGLFVNIATEALHENQQSLYFLLCGISCI